MSKSIGRNNPCPCGNKKLDGTPVKYKKCCFLKKIPLPSPEETKKIIAFFQKQILKDKIEKQQLEEKGIFINYVKPCHHTDPITKKGGTFWALGSQIFNSSVENETFHMFIINHLRETLGRDWWTEQLQAQEKHFIFKCFIKYDEWAKKNQTESNRFDEHTWFAHTDGWAKTLSSLAFDICSLENTKQLPDHFIRRLRNKNEYQGAHYEISVASIFARLGCTINFLDDEKNTEKHCEFIATHNETKVSIAVEAKSRHRRGIKNQSGFATSEELLRGDVKRLFKDALKQNPKNGPFVIFIDINAPLTPNIEMSEKPWFKDIKNILSEFPEPTKETPEEYTSLFFTNYSPHYNEENLSTPNEYLSVIPLFTVHPLPSQKFSDILFRAIQNYGFVPNIVERKDKIE